MITEGSGLVLPLQVCSPFKMISVTAAFQPVEMEKCSAEKEEDGLHSWPVCMAEGISDLSIASFRKQHGVKPDNPQTPLQRQPVLFR